MATEQKQGKPYGGVPGGAKQQPESFELHIDKQKIQDMKTLIRLSPIAKETYENLHTDGRFGVNREWMLDMKKYWLEAFDWHKHEDHINSLPNFKQEVTDDDGRTFNIHFAALFSKKKDAIPIALFHGWPGSFLEFLPIMDLLQKKYTPEDLPYHIIIPSLPGYGLSDQPPLDKDWRIEDTARIMHKLILSLGITSYMTQGGDIGSFIARTIAVLYPECKAVHLNFMWMPPSTSKTSLPTTNAENKSLQRLHDFINTGSSYGLTHAFRPSTIGLALSASPLALLAWIGEKFLEWSDPSTRPSIDTILADITLYWLTDSFPTSIYTYRQDYTNTEEGYFHGLEKYKVEKPMGYSYFPYELGPIPRSWAETTGRMVWFEEHGSGGHFAALERPEVLLRDVEGFVGVVVKEGAFGGS
ncbi:alpha/beta-hydrolase [Amniculicola lignicola CBS 123094]|uniref:Alpha/beta-hydrolase n=1 Tax=Amniculicola lignicola CBS 123094 TaxID=1392246 RepID=A0A6A5W249_9PLEO|nr:alpha/beta-hydrolase [Amniculicola lignicola CBS 123094]